MARDAGAPGKVLPGSRAGEGANGAPTTQRDAYAQQGKWRTSASGKEGQGKAVQEVTQGFPKQFPTILSKLRTSSESRTGHRNSELE